MARNRSAARISNHLALAAWIAFATPGCTGLGLRGELEAAPLAEEIQIAVPFHVIAHRGASADAPENTLPAFALARELGASDVELDVRMSRDGVLVLFHDSTLDRKTSLRGRVADHDAATLLATDIGTWFDGAHPEASERYAGTTIPTLESLFEAQGRALHYHVELKGEQPTLPDATLAAIERYDLIQNATLTSFSFEQLQRVRELHAEVGICLLLRDASTPFADMPARARASLLSAQREGVDRAARAGFSQVGIRAVALSAEIIEYARDQHGLEVRAWGVGSMQDMEYALAVGANGMTIDWPDRLIARLRELGWDEEARKPR